MKIEINKKIYLCRTCPECESDLEDEFFDDGHLECPECNAVFELDEEGEDNYVLIE